MEKIRSRIANVPVMLLLVLCFILWCTLPVSAQVPDNLDQAEAEDLEAAEADAMEAAEDEDLEDEAAVINPVLLITDRRGVSGRVTALSGNVSNLKSVGRVLTDIALCPGGRLFGMDFSRLYRINTSTGRATLIGSHGIPGGNALVCRSDGKLFGAGFSSTSLFRITLNSAGTLITQRTNLGNLRFRSAGDLEFHRGSFYLASTTHRLILIRLRANDTVLSTQDKGPFGFTNVFGLVSASDNVLYGISGTRIFSVNTLNGRGTIKSNYAGKGLDLANGATR